MSIISLDFETRSEINLVKTGVYPYAEHESTDIWCLSYSIDGAEPQTWSPHHSDYSSLPHDLLASLPTAEMRAWNAPFEKAIWDAIMVGKYGWPEIRPEQWVDSAAEAAALQLPRSLAGAAEALGLEQQKDMGDRGKKLMLKMCKPRRIGCWWIRDRNGTPHGPFATKAEATACMRGLPGGSSYHQDSHTILWWEDDEMLEDLILYCENDVRTEQAVVERLGRRLTGAERQVELMTQRMNDRGVNVDWDLVHAAKEALDVALPAADERIYEITDGRCGGVTKLTDMQRWVVSRGIPISNLRKDTVRDLLAGELPDDVREVLQLRQDAGKTSTAKLDAFLNARASDDKVHGLLKYHGAGTGRWSGQLIQPQNLPRPEFSRSYIEETIIPVMLDGTAHKLPEPVPAQVASALRSMFIPSEGHVFYGGDYAQIEARVLAWMAGQEDLVDLFARDGKVYEEMAARIYSKAVSDVEPDERQVGKMAVLGCGYGMGAEKFADQVYTMTGIRLDGGMATRAVQTYRDQNHRIKSYWYRLENAALNAVRHPGSIYSAGGGVDFLVKGQFLWCKLPSSRLLAYANPRVTERMAPWGDMKDTLEYSGVGFNRKWQTLTSYGGHLAENVVQATARDVLAGAMLRCEHAGLLPVLTVHDEVVVEAPEPDRLDEFLSILQRVPSWAQGLPVKAEGWTGMRYRK